MAALHFVVAYLAIFSLMVIPSLTQLSPTFYHEVCPLALPTIKAVVRAVVLLQPRMGASLVRLHFHDCFVNGCDGSILLDDNSTFIGEKTALPNNNYLRGFDVIDIIILAVDKVCLGHVVSCADILAVAARDSVVSLGGASYQVQVGRRDSKTASRSAANTNLPPPFFDFPALLSNFQAQGMNLQDLVVLSGSHTIGFARCTTFRSRIYNETTINNSFAASRQAQCPQSGGDNYLSPLDGSGTSATLNKNYYSSLLQQKGLLHSDQQLFQGDVSTRDGLVKFYSQNKTAFWADFGASIIKMGSLGVLTGTNGEIRENCRVVNLG